MLTRLANLLSQHDVLSGIELSTPEAAGSVVAGAALPQPGPLVLASGTDYLATIPPIAVFANAGDHVSLQSILTTMFGNNWDTYNGFQLAYYGPQTLQDWDFNYWNPDDPQVARWYVDDTDIGPAGNDFAHRATISDDDVASTYLVAGNNISNFAYIEVPVAYNAQGQVTELQQFSVVVVDPSFQVNTAGVPTPHGIVVSAQTFAESYHGLINDNDCDKIACALSSAVGAALNIDAGDSTDPTENQSGGFWRIVYRGSDPNPVTNWQTLAHPGDIVRMGWEGGGHHTTTVLGVNSDGSIRVFDNAASSHGNSIIAIHRANYQADTNPTAVTIFRLSPDHLYLINGSTQSETLVGTTFNDQILGFAGNDTLCGGVGGDLLWGYNGNDSLHGGGGADRLYGLTGADRMNGNGGADVFHYGAVTDSAGSQFDTVVDFNFAKDSFDLWFAVDEIDAAVTGATVRTGHVNHDVASAVSAELQAHDAILVEALHGRYAGEAFLVVDVNGAVGYQAGEDLLIHLHNARHIGAMDVSDFTGAD